MTFKQFLDTYNGQQNVGNTTENKGECVGLVSKWVDSLSLPHIWGNACDLFANADEKFFTKILNTPDAIPQAGDIIVWSAKFNGTVGHTGIATGTADMNTLEVFEQNDPTGSNCHLKTYKYNYVTGWLRPKIITSGTDPIILAQSDAFIAVCTKLNLPANRDVVLAELDKLIQMQDAVIQKDKQLADAQKKTAKLEKANTDKESQLKTFQDQIIVLQDAVSKAQIENQTDKVQIEELKKTCNPTPVLTGFKKWLWDNFIK